MPLLHRARPTSAKAGHKKQLSSELTSDATMKFVNGIMANQKKLLQSSAAKPLSNAGRKGKRSSGSHDGPLPKLVCPNAKGDQEQDDHEPCVMCKIPYGDKNDPKGKDNWESCAKCKGWWHETCAALSGTYDKKSIFTCDQCSFKKGKGKKKGK